MIRAVGLAILLAACSVSQPSGPQGVRFDDEGVRFTAPIGWQVEPSGAAALGSGHWLVYLATQTVHERCGVDASGKCLPPLDELKPGGVLIAWYTMNCAGTNCTLPAGQPTLVGGREAVVVAAPDACGQIGQTEETQYLVGVSPQRIDTIVICGRDTSESTRRTIHDFLDGVGWRTP